jgi:hypothetical protein
MKELAAEDQGRGVGPLSRLIGSSPRREIDDEQLRLMVTLPPHENYATFCILSLSKNMAAFFFDSAICSRRVLNGLALGEQ